MADHDYYQVLEVPRGASADEIRKSYRKLARQYHPDMRPNDKAAEKKFKEVQEAFDILGDEEKRKQYDQFGADFFNQGRGGPGPGAGAPPWSWSGAGGGGPVDLNDLFGGGQIDLGDLFGGAAGRGGRRRARGRKGQDAEIALEVPFAVAVEGGTQDVHLQRGDEAEHLSVKIPAGVETGSVIRLARQGQPGSGGADAGDLLIRVRVLPHPYFRREGNDLLVDVPVTVSEAALGAKVEAPTLSEGRVTLTIPAALPVAPG